MIVHVVLSGQVIEGVDTTWPESVWFNEHKAEARRKALDVQFPSYNRFFYVEEMEVEDAD